MSIFDCFRKKVVKEEQPNNRNFSEINDCGRPAGISASGILSKLRASEYNLSGYYLDDNRLKAFIKKQKNSSSSEQILRDFYNFCTAEGRNGSCGQQINACSDSIFSILGKSFDAGESSNNFIFQELIDQQSEKFPFPCSSDDMIFFYFSADTANKFLNSPMISDEKHSALQKCLRETVASNTPLVLFALDVQYDVIRGYKYGLEHCPYLIQRILAQDPIIEHRASFADMRLRRLIDVVKAGIPIREELKIKLDKLFLQNDHETDEDVKQAAMPYKDQKKIQIYYGESEQWDGFSHLGGYPRFPAGLNVPCGRDGEPMPLLAQISCSSLPSNAFLPESGYLYFFYDASEGGSGESWGMEKNDNDSWKVIYSTDDPLPKEQTYDSYRIFKSKKISFALENAYSDDVYEHGSFHANSVISGVYAHQMLGAPWRIPGTLCSDTIPSAICNEMTDASEDTEWVILLQLGSEEGTSDAINWMWGDCGQLTFWIRKDDLAVRDFSRVWMLIGDQ